jgi:predicted metallopeptidase
LNWIFGGEDGSSAVALEEKALSVHAELIRSWSSAGTPLPLRVIRTLRVAAAHPMHRAAPPWIATGGGLGAFDFCGHVSRLCEDIIRRSPELRHIDLSRVLFGATQARSGRGHGLQARVTPLRFHGGQLTHTRHGARYQVQRYLVDGREMLYVMTFCLPRFLDQDFDDKFITLFHELYHISPAFNGDLRRHDGRCAIHSRSKRAYDEQMTHLARDYLARKPDPALHAFLRLDFAQLEHRHGQVVAVVVPRPKLIPVSSVPARAAGRRG